MKVILKIKGVDDFGKENAQSTYKYSHHHPKTYKGDVIIYYYPKGDSTSTTGKLMIGSYLVTKETEHYYKDGFSYEEGLMQRLTGPERSGGFTEWHLSIRKSHPKIWQIIEDLVVNTLKKYNPEYILQESN